MQEWCGLEVSLAVKEVLATGKESGFGYRLVRLRASRARMAWHQARQLRNAMTSPSMDVLSKEVDWNKVDGIGSGSGESRAGLSRS